MVPPEVDEFEKHGIEYGAFRLSRGRHEGDELPNGEAVHAYALATAHDLVLRTRMDTIRSWFDCTFEVTDESGRLVLVMPFDEVVAEFGPDY